MRTIVKTTGEEFEIDESLFPLGLYSPEVVEHINNNTHLSEKFFNTEMKTFLEIRQKMQREYGVFILPDLVDKMGNRNLELSGTINVAAVAQDNAGVKMLLETGALTTAMGLANQLKVKYPTHADIYDDMINKVQSFLLEKGFI